MTLKRFLLENRNWIAISCIYVFLLLIGGVLFGWAEPFPDPRYLNGVYFSFITLATIGYGDLLPTHAGTRLWVCLYATIGVSLFSFIIGTASAKGKQCRFHVACSLIGAEKQ